VLHVPGGKYVGPLESGEKGNIFKKCA